MDHWTNDSVVEFAGEQDPIDAIETFAQRVVFEAAEAGWSGPPFDPFELARLRGIPVLARQEVPDARTVPVGGSKVAIEYNPTRPQARLRFSIAHEIAHTFFPDVSKAARYRSKPSTGPSDAWQLELLCNIAAGALLMPTGSVPELHELELELERLIPLKDEFGVSTEALLRRAIKLTVRPATMFAMSRTNPQEAASDFRLDYAVDSRAWSLDLPRGTARPSSSVLAECTAVGFTAKAQEDWTGSGQRVQVQAIGAPPFPGHRFPRVLGLLTPIRSARAVHEGEYTVLHGDATDPRGSGPRVIAHLVNDKTPNWGGAFATALKEAFPLAQEEFRRDIRLHPEALALGSVSFCEVGENLSVATMVAQHGYGSSTKPRIRYAALKECLSRVAAFAEDARASVHAPRIGAGQAGGHWPIVKELLDESLIRRGIDVTVYVPPGQVVNESAPEEQQLALGV
jgi:hypothetical protein